ncbi:MAG: hypothetical protein ACRCT8_08820 [Lacipirellulaceae bacterium]
MTLRPQAASVLSLVVVLLAGATPVAAQSRSSLSDGVLQPARQQGPSTPPNHHSSTFIEGYLRGRAAVLDGESNWMISRAQANFINAHAAMAWEDAKQLHGELFQQRVQNYLRSIERSRAHETERHQVGLKKLAERARDYYYGVYSLNSDELDRATGELAWPQSLRGEEFDDERQRIESLVRQMVMAGADPDELFSEPIIETAKEMRNRLGDRELSAEVRREAVDFLVGLVYEAAFMFERDKASQPDVAQASVDRQPRLSVQPASFSR